MVGPGIPARATVQSFNSPAAQFEESPAESSRAAAAASAAAMADEVDQSQQQQQEGEQPQSQPISSSSSPSPPTPPTQFHRTQSAPPPITVEDVTASEPARSVRIGENEACQSSYARLVNYLRACD
jgi:hypothetical protein